MVADRHGFIWPSFCSCDLVMALCSLQVNLGLLAITRDLRCSSFWNRVYHNLRLKPSEISEPTVSITDFNWIIIYFQKVMC